MSEEEVSEQGQEEDDSAASKAKQEEEEVEQARKQMDEIEEGDPPGDLEDWPGGKAKYQTYGGPEGESGYDEGATSKLGPSSLRHHEDGQVSIEGEEVDNPDEYKGEPIPGGPSDPDAPPDPAMIGNEKEEAEKESGDSDSGDDDSDSGDSDSGDSDTEARGDDDSSDSDDRSGSEQESRAGSSAGDE